MTWTQKVVTTPSDRQPRFVQLQGRVVGTDGQPYNYSIRYGASGSVHLVPIG